MKVIRKANTYTQEFKEESVWLMTEGNMSLGQAAWELGINDKMLSRWKRLAQAQEKKEPGAQLLTEEVVPRLSQPKPPIEPM